MFLFKIKAKYVYKLEVLDMRCGMCEAHIEDTVRKNFNIKKVVANRHKNLVTIYSNEELDIERIKQVISATGYRLMNIVKEKES